MSGEDSNDGTNGDHRGRGRYNDDAPRGGYDGWGRSTPGFSDPGAQQRHWESLSSQYPGSTGQGGGEFPSVPPGTAATAAPSGESGGAGAAGASQARRFSTPAVAALLVAVAIGASGVTAAIMQSGSDDDAPAVTSSLNQTGSGERENTAATDPDPGTVEEVAANVLPSVVSIEVTSGQGGAEGSGSIISSDGMILTNNHVVAEAADGGPGIVVTTNDGRQLQAEVVATDPQTDLAVVKADGADDLQPIAIGDSDALEVGETVIAVGSPLGLSSTVTTGIVSAMNRPVQAGGEDGGEASLIDAVQTDAAINPGNSGGALVNLQGELVGIPSVIATLGGQFGGESGSIGLGFAIPSNQAENTAQQLIDTGTATHPVIGATVNTGMESSAPGAEIISVTDGGPADEAGLRDGDIVTRVGDRIVDNGVSLIAAIRSQEIGDDVTLTVTDGDGENEREIDVTLSESDSD